VKKTTTLVKPKSKNYDQYPFMNLSLDSMEGEEWADIPGFDGCYCISNYGRIWAAPRLIVLITGQMYYTKERIRKQSINKYYNTYTKSYTEQLQIHLRYEGQEYGFKVNRLVYNAFVAPINFREDKLVVVHKDGDNCNNRYDNLVLMNGTERYIHELRIDKRPRSGITIKKANKLTWSDRNSPRPVVKYSLDGKKIKEYASVADAAKDNNTSRGGIRAVVLQKAIQLYGFVYRFKDDPYKGEHKDFSIEKLVTQYDLKGRKIRTFPSVKEAGIQTGTPPEQISKCALRKARIAGGYVWRYKGDSYKGEYKDKIKNQAKKLIQYSLDGKQIATFSSVNEASAITGYTAATLLDCAHKRAKVSHGFVWRFENDSYKGEHKSYRIGKPVTQYTLSGKKIKTYPTIQAAANETGLTSDNIQKNVNGHNRTAGGFVWKFANTTEIQKLPASQINYTPNVQGREVIQYSLEGKKLTVYPTIAEAAKALGLIASNISFALNNPTRTAGGYVWRTKGNIYRGALAKNPAANSARMVTQYNMEGEKINVYPSMREASKATGASAIYAVVSGKLKSTGGYIWQYGDGPKRIDIKSHFASTLEYRATISKAVAKYSIEGELLKEYPSIREAARAEGINTTSIASAVNGKSKSAGGYLWELVTS